MINEEVIQLVCVSESSELTNGFRTIYEDAFPPDERREWKQINDLLGNRDFSLMGIYHHQTLIGIVSIWDLPEFRFLEHFAICDSERGKGFGTKVIQQIVAQGSTPVILEVEIPNTETALNRIKFYERLNFTVCEDEYFQPPYSIDKSEVKMLLMSYPEPILKDNFQLIKNKIHASVYKTET